MQHTHCNKSGFTLVETMVAMLILGFLLITMTALINRFTYATTTSQDRYIAAQLAAEGIDLIKAKRSRNVITNTVPWTMDLIGTWSADSTQKLALSPGHSFLPADPSSPDILCIRTSPPRENGKYSHSCDPSISKPLPGNFTRIVEVTQLTDYSIQVTCTVTWNNGTDSVKVSMVMYEIA